MAQRNRNVSLKPGKSRVLPPQCHRHRQRRPFVAVPPERDDEPVRAFPSFTVDFYALAD